MEGVNVSISHLDSQEKVYDVNYLWRKLTRERDEAQRLAVLKRREVETEFILPQIWF